MCSVTVILVDSLFPDILCWYIFEKGIWNKDVKRRVQKNI